MAATILEMTHDAMGAERQGWLISHYNVQDGDLPFTVGARLGVYRCLQAVCKEGRRRGKTNEIGPSRRYSIFQRALTTLRGPLGRV